MPVCTSAPVGFAMCPRQHCQNVAPVTQCAPEFAKVLRVPSKLRPHAAKVLLAPVTKFDRQLNKALQATQSAPHVAEVLRLSRKLMSKTANGLILSVLKTTFKKCA